jgi:phosphopantothenoylcysteine synthetase/decarboxylase
MDVPSRDSLPGTVLLAITGAVAAISMPAVIGLIRQHLQLVAVLMSEAAVRFISVEPIRLRSEAPVFTDLHQQHDKIVVPHVQLSSAADVLLIMPATANIIGKAAHGIADDLVSAAIVASAAPVVFVPCMNTAMWANPIVQQNVATLRLHNYVVLEPRPGTAIAGHAPGIGAMAPIGQVLAVLLQTINRPRAISQP